jgi:S1-C subfamily serine protease
MSALGLPAVVGILVLHVPAGSLLEKSGVQKGDVVVSVNGTKTPDMIALLQQENEKFLEFKYWEG